jgi:transmembrane sensor
MTHPPDSEAFWEMLARYVSGESTLPEAETVRRWLEEAPERKALVDALERSISGFEVEPADVDVEAALRTVEERMDGPDVHRLPVEIGGAPVAAPKKARRPRRVAPASADGAERPKSVPSPAAAPPTPKAPVDAPPVRQRPILIPAAEAPTLPLRPAANAEPAADVPSRRGWLRIAAAIVVLLGGALVWQRMPGPRPAATSVTLSTGVGATDTTFLGDGTRVILGPESRMVVAAGYGEDNRAVELTGEALFDVAHADVPFTVSAGGAVMEDLGTVFNVRAVGGEVVVAVTEGSVSMSGIVLKAGDRAVMAAGSAPVLQQGAVTDADLAWTAGQLVFVDAPISRVTADIRRWYGVEVQVPDTALASSHLNVSFGGEPVDEVLQGIALALGADLIRDGKVVVLRVGAGKPN